MVTSGAETILPEGGYAKGRPRGNHGSRPRAPGSGPRYFAWMNPSAVSSSAVSTAPPAAPRTVLCESETNR